jgi:GrpB-like predicted nucleotidyltransferase (UPF0157 family)
VDGLKRPDSLNEPCAASGAGDGPLAGAAFAAVLVHGLKPTQVVLADHDRRWARRFAARATELRRVLGERVGPVEHVGSTAVPGLAAKPVVDILAGIDDPDDEAAYLPDLEAAGYDLTVREPQHRCLRAGDPGEPVNLHCYPPGHPEIRKLLLFRDHLRRNARDRRRYEAAKRELATRQWRDMDHYAAAKSPVIGEILRNAGWTPPLNIEPQRLR